MANTEIILQDDVPNLGNRYEVVRVKSGFARNYLLPQGLALPATASNRKDLEEKQRQASHRENARIAEAQELADKIAELTLEVQALVGKEGKLFGSVTPLQIANKLKEAGYEVDRRKISLPDNIKQVGEYEVKVLLYKDIHAQVKLNVVAAETK